MQMTIELLFVNKNYISRDFFAINKYTFPV